ncbi:response regulator transcription factor [Phaeobacter inhibens]|uniref:response regulator transcription factor n=1 Tax=Phaeobacter inhibens TaxID=221822 RepID=UPI00076BB974|nr:response regulator transcription factor [Phaeobacter inhibens]KXF91461.1 XRE family transcriptional regulator [Phaeobacter inhibens]WHP67027.1 response regulator transcription factor [Phaeobacter inhibens]
MRILLLEDDPEIGTWTVKGLTAAGHVVDWIENGREALLAATTRDYDVLVFDRMTPDLDGLSALKTLRSARIATPLILLTALGAVEDRVEGLEAGADDYLSKPFAMTELLARITALCRRGRGEAAETATRLSHRGLDLDLLSQTCACNGTTVLLNPKEFRLLEVLMRSKGRIQTRAMLLERVWDINFDPSTSVVETHMSRLRNKIEKPFGLEFIKTVRGSGYMFID